METTPWALYRVRRIYRAKAIYKGEDKARRLVGYDANLKGIAERCVERLQEFDSQAMADEELLAMGAMRGIALREAHDLKYLPITECASSYPTSEDYFVTAPAVVETKARYGVKKFDFPWADLTGSRCGQLELPLLDTMSEHRLIQIT